MKGKSWIIREKALVRIERKGFLCYHFSNAVGYACLMKFLSRILQDLGYP